MAVNETAAGPTLVLDDALKGVAEALGSDGFSLAWTTDREQRVSFVITGDAAACAECLVPQPVLVAMLSQALEATPFTVGDVHTAVLP